MKRKPPGWKGSQRSQRVIIAAREEAHAAFLSLIERARLHPEQFVFLGGEVNGEELEGEALELLSRARPQS